MSGKYDRHVGERHPNVLQILYGLLETQPQQRLGAEQIWSMIDGPNLK